MHSTETSVASGDLRPPLYIRWLHYMSGAILVLPSLLLLWIPLAIIVDSRHLFSSVLSTHGLGRTLTTYSFDLFVLLLLILAGVTHVIMAIALILHKRWCIIPLALVPIPFIGYLILFHVYGLSELTPGPYQALGVVMALLMMSVALLVIFTRKHFHGPPTRPAVQGTLITLLLSPLILVALPLMYRDGPPVDDSHLRLHLEKDDDSGLTALQHLAYAEAHVHKNTTDDTAPPLTGQDTTLSADDVEFLSERFVEASYMPHTIACERYVRFDMLPEAPLHCAQHESMAHARRIALIVRDHAISVAENGAYDAAYRYAVSILRMGHGIAMAHGNSIFQARIALSIYRIGLDTLHAIAEIDDDFELPDQVKEDMRALRPTDTFIRDMYRFEYEDHRMFVLHFNYLHANLETVVMELDYPALELIRIAPSSMRTRYFFHPNNTLRYFTRTYEYLIVHGTETCDTGGPDNDPRWEIVQSETERAFVSRYAAPAGLLRPNHIGVDYAATRPAAVSAPIRFYCEILDEFEVLLAR